MDHSLIIASMRGPNIAEERLLRHAAFAIKYLYLQPTTYFGKFSVNNIHSL